MIGDLDRSSRPVCVKEDEQVDGAVAPIFVVVTFKPAQRRRDSLSHFADQLRRAFVKANHRTL